MATHFIDKEPNRGESDLQQKYNQIQTLDANKIIEVVRALEAKWKLLPEHCNNVSFSRLGFTQFFAPEEIDEKTGFPRDIQMRIVDTKRDRELGFLKNVASRVKALELTTQLPDENDEGGAGLMLSERLCRLIKQVDEGFKNVRFYFKAGQRISDPRNQPDKFDADPEYFDANPMDAVKLDKCNPHQRAIVACLNETYRKEMRRYKDNCMIQRRSEGHYTRAWKPTHTIKAFVHEFADKDINFDFWQDITSKGRGIDDVIRHLSSCHDSQFPEIIKDRHMWSFKNGVFLGKVWCPEQGVYDCKFYPYESKEFMCLDPTKVSCKYFDQYFEDYSHVSDWYDIPTPHFQRIMDYQGFEEDVCKWMYVMGGRLCYDTGDLDHWQVIGFLKGVARSGKSTLITKVFKKFYESEDVKTLSNNIEKKFGLSSICDALLFIAPEVKGDLALEQAEFQSLVSGEDVSIAVKHAQARSMEWRTPGVLGGNEVPGWKDNSGSILRRILPWNFSKQVKDADPHLDAKLNDEMPAIMLKCIRAYIDYAQKYSNKDIWNVVPQYFKEIQKKVAMVASTLTNFLEQSNVKFGKDLYIPQRDFVAQFQAHCTTNNLGKPKFNEDFYQGPFSSRDLEVRVASLEYRGAILPSQPFIFGVDVLEE
jgi:hypothetical protein